MPRYLHLKGTRLLLIFLEEVPGEYSNWLIPDAPEIGDGYRIISVKKGEHIVGKFVLGEHVRVIGGYDGGKIEEINTEFETATIKSPTGECFTVSLDLLIKRGEDPAKAS